MLTRARFPLVLSTLLLGTPVGVAQQIAKGTGSGGEPRDIIALARLRNADVSIATAQGFLPLPGVLQSAFQTALGPLQPAIATSAPVDVLVALDPESADKAERPVFGVSVGLQSMDAAQKVISSHLRGQISETQERGLFSVKLTLDNTPWYCLLGAAVGAAPARIVCADRARDVDIVARYMMRGLPRVQLGNADLHIEVRVQPAVQRYGTHIQNGLGMGAVMLPQKLQLGHARFDRALTDMTQGLAEQLNLTLADFDRMTFDIGLAQAGVEVRAGYKLLGKRSYLARTIREEAAGAGPPPPIFYRLPADAAFASYVSFGYSKQLTDSVVMPLKELLDAWLEHEGVGPADRQFFGSFLDTKIPPGPLVWASGPTDTGPPNSTGSKAGQGQGPMSRFFSTYYLVGYPQPMAPLATWAKSTVGGYNRPAFQGFVKKKLKGLDLDFPLPVLKQGAAAKDLPTGSLEWSGTAQVSQATLEKLAAAAAGKGGKGANIAPAKAKGKGGMVPVTFYLVLMPEGERTWLAFGADRATLIRRLKGVAVAEDAQTLARKAGLSELRGGTYSSGGFFTLSGMAREIWKALSETQKKDPQEIDKVLNVAPHHGETPMTFFARSVEGATMEREIVFRLPKDTIEDLVAMAMNLGGASNSQVAPAPKPKK